MSSARSPHQFFESTRHSPTCLFQADYFNLLHIMMIQSGKQNESSEYRFDIAIDRMPEEYFLSIWNQLLSNSESQDAIYQTPGFFKFLLETSADKSRLKIFSVTRNDGDQLVGILPIRIRSEAIAFQAGSKKFWQKNFQVIGLLGSIPLVDAEVDLIEKVFMYLMSQFDDCQAICMAALPSSSTLWKAIKCSPSISKNFFIHVVDGWRQCHTIPIPSSFESYLQQFSTKKRYNLNRQIRLLREHCGTLFLHRIQTPADVPRLTSAIKNISKIEERGIFLSEEKCQTLAKHDLLLCYVLDCGEAPEALIFGTKSSDVLHIHNILYSEKFSQFSIGTSILHLAMEDLATCFNLSSIDLGYGVPGHNYQSSNITKERGYVLIFRKNLKNRLLCWLHQLYGRVVAIARMGIKKWMKN